MAKPSLNYKVTQRSPSDLRERPGNPRSHNRRQIQTIIASIRRFGFTNPVLVDDQDMIIAGHARVQAATEIGLPKVPVICLSHLTQAELKAYVIADNRTAELATWDRELLADSIASIELLDDTFDLSITGFDHEEIDLLGDYITSKKTKPEASLPAVDGIAISRVGDIWEIDGRHRVLCGDATLATSYPALLGSDRADLVITDPPWNCPIQGHVSGLGKNEHREFVAASGEMTPEQFCRFLERFMHASAQNSRSGSVHYIFCDWRILRDVLTIADGIYDQMLNLAVWKKNNAGMGTGLRSQHELCVIYRKGRRSHVNNVKLGVHGRHRSNVWEFAGANSFGAGRDEALAMHPTVKPVKMIAEAIKDSSHPDDIILDPFGGSGTTLIACKETGRRARLMELDPLYVDLIVRRAAREGMSTALGGTGKNFETVQQLGRGNNE